MLYKMYWKCAENAKNVLKYVLKILLKALKIEILKFQEIIVLLVRKILILNVHSYINCT